MNNDEQMTIDAEIREDGEPLAPEENGAPAGGQPDVPAQEENGEDYTFNGLGTYGDSIIRELSVEANVRRVHNVTKLSPDVVKYIVAAIYIVCGVLCAVFHSAVESALAYIVGGLLCVGSLIQFIFALIKKEYRRKDTNKTVSSLVLLALGVMLILDEQWAETFIPFAWGLLGLCEGAYAFNHAIYRISHGMRSAFYIIKGIVEVVIAFLLMYRPETYAVLHIIVFGISLALDGVSILPFIEKLINR